LSFAVPARCDSVQPPLWSEVVTRDTHSLLVIMTVVGHNRAACCLCTVQSMTLDTLCRTRQIQTAAVHSVVASDISINRRSLSPQSPHRSRLPISGVDKGGGQKTGLPQSADRTKACLNCTKFGQFILRKMIIKTIAIGSHILKI